MRFLIINTDYPAFIQKLLECHPGYDKKSFDEQHHLRMATLFGMADFYSSNLRALGHEAWDVIANLEPLQRQWAREQGFSAAETRWRFRLRRGWVPWFSRMELENWLINILAEQVRRYRPDVIYSMAMETIGTEFLKRVKGYYRLAIGQHAAPLPTIDYSAYDLVLSSLPNQIDHFRALGLKADYLRLGFESRVLDHVGARAPTHPIVFVGGLGGHHEAGAMMLDHLARALPVRVWGYSTDQLPVGLALHGCCHGPLWGVEMYRVLRDAKIVFNRHIDVAGPYANNMRLYESTGVGACLLTDAKSNLADLFEPGREVLVYHSMEECLELARHYLEHDNEREAIALAGQQRTLRDHTYTQRMQELVEIVKRYL